MAILFDQQSTQLNKVKERYLWYSPLQDFQKYLKGYFEYIPTHFKYIHTCKFFIEAGVTIDSGNDRNKTSTE